MSGWIKFYRKYLKWEWFQDKNTCFFFIYLLLSVNFEDKKWQGLEIPKGSLVTSLPKLAKATGLSVKQIRGILDKLEKSGEVARKTTNRNTIISLKKYSFYQSDGRQDGSQYSDDWADNETGNGHSEGIQTAQTQEFKNLNNFKKINNAGARDGNTGQFQTFSDLLKSKGIDV